MLAMGGKKLRTGQAAWVGLAALAIISGALLNNRPKAKVNPNVAFILKRLITGPGDVIGRFRLSAVLSRLAPKPLNRDSMNSIVVYYFY